MPYLSLLIQSPPTQSDVLFEFGNTESRSVCVSHLTNSHLSRDAKGTTQQSNGPQGHHLLKSAIVYHVLHQPESGISCICLFEEEVILLSLTTCPAKKGESV